MRNSLSKARRDFKAIRKHGFTITKTIGIDFTFPLTHMLIDVYWQALVTNPASIMDERTLGVTRCLIRPSNSFDIRIDTIREAIVNEIKKMTFYQFLKCYKEGMQIFDFNGHKLGFEIEEIDIKLRELSFYLKHNKVLYI